MATRGIVPRANGEGSIGSEKKRWGAIFAEKVAVKALEVIGGGTENDAQPATVGWVKQGFLKLLQATLKAAGLRVQVSWGKSGYICFGDLFGGLIVQWGEASWGNLGKYTEITYPIAFQRSCFVIPIDTLYGDVKSIPQGGIPVFAVSQEFSTTTKARIVSNVDGIGAFNFLAIGF